MPTRGVPDVRFHSLNVGKSYANPMSKTKPKSNPNTNPAVTLTLLNPTNPNTLTVTLKRQKLASYQRISPQQHR